MNIDVILRGLWAMPTLLLPGLFGHHGDMPRPQATPAALHSPAPAASPKAVVKASPKPAKSPSATATPAPSAAPVASAKSEIASEATCPGQSDVAKTAAALTCLTTQAREYHKLTAISGNAKLMASAGAKAQDMQSCGYGHTACGHAFSYWITAKGYTGRCSAENIAMGQKTPREVFIAWMNSAGHRANILNGDYRDIGVAELSSVKGPLWVMQLGGC